MHPITGLARRFGSGYPDGLTVVDAVSDAAPASVHMNAPVNEVIKLFLKNHCQFCDAHRFKSMRRYRADSSSHRILGFGPGCRRPIVIYKRNLSRWCGSESAQCDCDSDSSRSKSNIGIHDCGANRAAYKRFEYFAWMNCIKADGFFLCKMPFVLLLILLFPSHWNVIFCELCRDEIQLEKLLKHLINWNWIDYMKVASKIHLSICVRAICVPSSQSVLSIIVKSENGRNLANFWANFIWLKLSNTAHSLQIEKTMNKKHFKNVVIESHLLYSYIFSTSC